MATVQAPISHIHFDERGVPWIDDTNIKVIEVVLDSVAHGLSPEEIHLEHYRGLSLAQIHSALGYYHDHKAEIDAEIERQVQEADALRVQAGEPPFMKRLRAAGKNP